MAFGKTSTAEEVTEGLDLSGKTYLITGVNSGLGYETARVLVLRGAKIVGLARTKAQADGALEELGADGVGVACELSDLTSVRAAVETVRGLEPLDAVIANAGIMALPELQQVQGVERQLFTNHVGHFVLVNGILDRLTNDGRVVILSSGAHYYADRGIELDNVSGETDYAPWRAYGRSKLANILFARSLSRQFAGTNKVANSLHPGVIKTNLARHVPDPESMFESLKSIMKTVGQGAATQVYVATHPDAASISGEYFSDCAVAEVLQSDGFSDEKADALWAWTEELVTSV